MPGQTNTSREEIITINPIPPTPSQNQPATPPKNSSPTPEGSQEAAHRMMLPSPAATPLKRSAAIETPKGIRRVRLKLPQTQPVAEDGSAIEDEDVNMESTEVSNSLPGKTIMTDHARSPFLDFTAGCRGTLTTTHIYSRPSRSCKVNEKEGVDGRM